VSFILDALKKLERDKQAREPGVVMVGPVPWGGADRHRRGRRLVVAAVAVGAVLTGTWWWLRAGPTPSPTVDRGDAAEAPAEPAPVGGPAGSESPGSPADGATARLPTAAPERAAAPTGPPSVPPSRELDLPPAEPSPAALASREPAASGEVAEDVIGEAEDEGAEPSPPIEAAPDESVAPQPEFRLTAISTRDGQPIALLNDRLVREGDSFGGVRILRIGATEVEIEVDGERRTIGF
jgi:general secretion pathway protein B